MKTLLLLNSSMVVKKPYFSRDYIKIEYGNKRINSYVDGFINLQKLEIYKMFDETILIDNTISSTKNVPDQIIKLLPKNTIFLVNKNNTLGRTNKGAGMLKSLEKNVSFLKDYDFIFYFEPRLILKSSKFIKQFFENRINSFSMESGKRVKTGYFGSTSNDLIEFINSYKAEDLVEKNLHIELLMYEFYEKKNTNFYTTSISLWKNYLSGIYEEY
tara:strand:+ start:527 stop:1171 length:645 start_codon:yes stop_codon:yes gene_type:complete